MANNYISSRGLIVVDAVCSVNSIAFIALHTYGRLRFFRRLFLSDYLLLLSWLLWMPLQIADDYVGGKWGFDNMRITYGAHVQLPNYMEVIKDKRKVEIVLELSYFQQLSYQVAILCMKLVFLLTYDRLFPETMKRLHIALRITIATVLIGYCATLATFIFWCSPISSNWKLDHTTNLQTCAAAFNATVFSLSTAVHVFTDLLLPFSLIRSGTISPYRNQRDMIAARIMFTLGFICVLITVIRLAVTNTSGRIAPANMSAFFAAHIAVPIVVACLPMGMRLLKTVLSSGREKRARDVSRACPKGGSGSGVSRMVECDVEGGARGAVDHNMGDIAKSRSIEMLVTRKKEQ